MNKLRLQMVAAFELFLLVVVGGMLLFYFFFAENYYIMRKEKVMNEAFETIRQFDLMNLGPENEAAFEKLEEESFSILICNDQLDVVYTSKIKGTDSLVQAVVAEQREEYRKDARAYHLVEKTGKPIILYGLITQGGQDFYVYINENTRVIRKGVAYANRFLVEILIITMLLGSVFAYALSTWIVRPLERIQYVTNRLAQNDFSQRLPENQPPNELGNLAHDVNCMAEKIQRNMNDLNNYNYLLLRQNRNMAEFEEMRKKMVGTITHELKTPLAIISSQVELLQYEYEALKEEAAALTAGLPPEERQRFVSGDRSWYFDSIMEEIDKMSALISTILQGTRMERQMEHPSIRETDLTRMMTGLLPKYESWLAAGDIPFDAEIEPGCVAWVDPTQIEQAVNNYVMNARRHTRPGGRTHLSLKEERGDYYISVYNQGKQLEKKEMDQIWTGFYQGKENTGEIGLGLYIVKDIMNRHQGACGVLNRQDGVEFWLKIPKGESI